MLLGACTESTWPGEPLTRWSYAWEPAAAAGSPAAVAEHLAWTALPVGEPPALSRDHHVLWLRASVPGGTWHEPVVFVPKPYLALAMYVDGRRVYAFDDYRAASGIPWHAIPIASPGPREVVFRMYSRYTRIGLAEPAYVGDRAQLAAAMYERDAVRLAFAVLFAIVAIAAAALAFRSRERMALLGLALYATALVVWALYHTKTKQLWWNAPAFWFAAWWIAIPALGAGVGWFIEGVFGVGPRAFVRRARQGFVVFTALAAISLVSDRLLELMAPVVYVGPRILGLLSFVLAGVYLGRRALRGERTAQIFTAGYVAASVCAVHDFAMSVGLAGTTEPWAHVGYALMTMSLVGIVRQRWRETDRALHEALRAREALLRDLHDGLGGIITNVRIVAERAQGTDDSTRALEAIAAHASDGVAELRTLMLGLDEAPATWRSVAAELRRTGSTLLEPLAIEHRFEAQLADAAPAPTTEVVLQLLRIHREALTNAIKHANARAVTVRMSTSARELVLEIADDGAGGGDASHGIGAGVGARSMQARAETIGGTLTITRVSGLTVRLVVPMQTRA